MNPTKDEQKRDILEWMGKEMNNKHRRLPFDWFVWLRLAIKKPPLYNKHQRARLLASQWATCACGQLCKMLPQLQQGGPSDRELRTLGFNFIHQIDTGRFLVALETMTQIECRTALLLAESRYSCPSCKSTDISTKNVNHHHCNSCELDWC